MDTLEAVLTEFGDSLTEARELAQLTRSGLAHLADRYEPMSYNSKGKHVSPSTVAHYERGETIKQHEQVVHKLWGALKFSYRTLIENEEAELTETQCDVALGKLRRAYLKLRQQRNPSARYPRWMSLLGEDHERAGGDPGHGEHGEDTALPRYEGSAVDAPTIQAALQEFVDDMTFIRQHAARLERVVETFQQLVVRVEQVLAQVLRVLNALMAHASTLDAGISPQH